MKHAKLYKQKKIQENYEQAKERFGEITKEWSLNPNMIYTVRRSHDTVKWKIKMAQKLRAEGYSFPIIGSVMRKDHSTIMYYMKKNNTDYS